MCGVEIKKIRPRTKTKAIITRPILPFQFHMPGCQDNNQDLKSQNQIKTSKKMALTPEQGQGQGLTSLISTLPSRFLYLRSKLYN